MSSLLDCGVIILAVTPLLKDFFIEEGPYYQKKLDGFFIIEIIVYKMKGNAFDIFLRKKQIFLNTFVFGRL